MDVVTGRGFIETLGQTTPEHGTKAKGQKTGKDLARRKQTDRGYIRKAKTRTYLQTRKSTSEQKHLVKSSKITLSVYFAKNCKN